MNETHNKEDHDKRLLELGKKLEAFYQSGYVNKKQTLYFSFLKGMMSGFGAVIGGTLLIAIILWLLGFFKEVPLLGPVAQNINHTIHSRIK